MSTIYYDNIAATFLTKNPIQHARTKHIAIHYHFIYEQMASRCLVTRFVASKNQLVDVLTKPLAQPSFHYLCDKLMEQAELVLVGYLFVINS